jgi:dTDP-4-dehydrorhamnose 3,5-epimerase-like enzyme
MIFHETRLFGVYIVEIEKKEDNRGFLQDPIVAVSLRTMASILI